MKDLSIELKVSLVLSLVLLGMLVLLAYSYNTRSPVFDLEVRPGDHMEFEYADKVDKLRYIEYRISEYDADSKDRVEILEMISILSNEDSQVAEILYEDFN